MFYEVPTKELRFTDSQEPAVLKEAEAGRLVSELCRVHGITSATFHKWRARNGGLNISLTTGLNELEKDSRRRK